MICVAEQSRALIEEILSSARGRQEAIDALKSWVAEFLAGSRMQHMESFRDTHARRCERVNGLAEETRAFLAECGDEQCAVAQRRSHAADEQRGRAAEGETARLDAFLRMHDRNARTCDRIAREVGTLVSSTHSFLQQCDTWQRGREHDVRQAARQLRQDLTGDDYARRAEFGRLRNRLSGRLVELRQTVRGHLAEARHNFTVTHAAWKHLAATRSNARRTSRRP